MSDADAKKIIGLFQKRGVLMKRSQTEKNEAILEFVLEIVFTIIGLGVGFVVYSLLGIDVGENTDYEWLSFVGIVVILAFFGGIGALVRVVKRRSSKGKEEDET